MQSTLSGSSVVKITPKQVSATLSGEAVILQLDKGVYFGLNSMGTLVWEKLQRKPRSIQELVTAIVEVYEVDAVTCMQDLQRFLDELFRKGLIEINAGFDS